SVERAARHGNSARHRFPRPLLDDPTRLEFSFSGLKTAVRYCIEKRKAEGGEQGAALSDEEVADIAASFQEAVVDCLVGKAELAVKTSGFTTLCVGGGVAANGRFRERLVRTAKERGFAVHIPPLSLCTVNAVMGAIAIERYRAGLFEDLSLAI